MTKIIRPDFLLLFNKGYKSFNLYNLNQKDWKTFTEGMLLKMNIISEPYFYETLTIYQEKSEISSNHKVTGHIS